jgi:hypothetical protein
LCKNQMDKHPVVAKRKRIKEKTICVWISEQVQSLPKEMLVDVAKEWL